MKPPRAIGGVNASPERLTLAFAIALHAAAFAISWATMPPALQVARSPTLVVASIDLTIAIDVDPTPTTELPRQVDETRPESEKEGEAPSIEPGRSTSATPGEPASKTTESPPSAGPNPNGAGEYDPLPEGGARLPGLGGVPAWSIPGVIGPLSRSAPAPTTTPRPHYDRDAGGRAIRSTLDARDRDRGMDLPAAGEAARAIQTVMESAETPGESRATFAVDLDSAGNIKSIALTNATVGNEAQWARVLARIKEALAGRRLTMRGDAAALGAKLSIRIETRERFPDGKKGSGAKNEWGEHKTRNVLAHVDVIVPGAKKLPENIKPIVIQPFFTPPDPKKSGVVPLTPGDAYRLHTPQQ